MHNFNVFLGKILLLTIGTGWILFVSRLLIGVPATTEGIAYSVVITFPGFAAFITSALLRFK